MKNIIEGFKQMGYDLYRQPRIFSFGTQEECRELFISAFKAVDATVQDFVYLPDYDKIVKWMSDTQGRGLLLSGNCGVGKTVITTGVIPLLFKYKFNLIVHPVNAIDINAKEKEIINRPFICIDDVGVEPIRVSYGERSEVFCNILDNAESKLKPLFISTNLTGKQVTERYGERAVDRICRLCCMIKITSPNGSLRPSRM